MRTLLVFLACIAPLGATLWLVDGGERSTARLPERGADDAHAPVLLGSDLADELGDSPLQGNVHRLDDLILRVVEEGYVKSYLRFQRLARFRGEPRLEEVTAAVFDAPKDGQPRLRLTLRAPYVTGDPAMLFSERKSAPKVATLAGGVVAHDAAGRTVAEMQELRLDLKRKTVSTDGSVLLRQPGRNFEVRGLGLVADIDLRRAELREHVHAKVPVGDAVARLSCTGGAIVQEFAKRGVVVVTLETGARLRHPSGTARCHRIVAEIGVEKDRYVLRHAALEGDVVLEFDEGLTGGLEFVSAPRLRIEGDHRILCDGPLKAVRRKPLAPLGLGARTLDVTAGSATILLRRGAKDRLQLEEMRLFDLLAKDRDGPSYLKARVLTYVVDGSAIEAVGGAEVRTPEGLVAAERLSIASKKKGQFTARLAGAKRVEYVADGRLGPLGKAARGLLRLTSKGPMRVASTGKEMRFFAREKVVATVDDRSRLEADELTVLARDEKLVSFEAKGSAALVDKARGAEAYGDRFAFDGKVARLAGAPAAVRLPGGRTVQGRTLVYRDDGRFEADGDVLVVAPLDRAGATELWRIRCGRARGALAENGPPRSVFAEGDVVADGPGGQHASGARFDYDGDKGTALLRGTPARLRRGKDLGLEAPGFRLGLVDNAVATADTLGDAVVEFRPGKATGVGGGSFKRWRIELDGPARLAELRLTVPGGARLQAFDARNESALRARANRVEVLLAKTKGGFRAERLLGSKGVEVVSRGGKSPAKVTADSLRFLAGSRKVDIFGDARVEAKGWSSEVSFEHVVFVLVKEGIDLRQASRVQVKPKSKPDR